MMFGPQTPYDTMRMLDADIKKEKGTMVVAIAAQLRTASLEKWCCT